MHTAVLERSIGHPIATTGGLSDAWRRFRRNRLAVLAFAYLVLVHAGAALAPWLGLHAPEAMDLLNQFASPSREHLLGTDETGRDVLSRLVYGARTSLIIGLAAMVVAVAIGIVLGALSGFYGGLSETLIMRLTDGMLTVPTFFLALLVLAVFGSNIANVVLVIGLTGWMVVARVYVNRDLKPYPHDVARAKALFAEAGFKPGPDGVLQKDGKRLAFSLMVDKGNPEREQIALYAQQSWKQLGADVKLDVEEWSVYIKRGNQIPSGDYDARTSWRITSADPDKTSEYTTGGVNNHYAYSNPEVDALMAKARATVDEGARVATYRKLQELIYRDAPIVWIYHQTEILAMNKRVKGYPDLSLRDALPWAHQIAVQ